MLIQDSIIGKHRNSPLGLDSWLTPAELPNAKNQAHILDAGFENERSSAAYSDKKKPVDIPKSNPIREIDLSEKISAPPPQDGYKNFSSPGLFEKLLGNKDLLGLVGSLFGKDFKLDAPSLLSLFSKEGGLLNLLGSFGELFKKSSNAEQTVDLKSYKRVE